MMFPAAHRSRCLLYVLVFHMHCVAELIAPTSLIPCSDYTTLHDKYAPGLYTLGDLDLHGRIILYESQYKYGDSRYTRGLLHSCKSPRILK